MLRTVLFASLLATVGVAGLAAQNGGSIRGVVTGADTREPVASARVAVDQPERVALTDSRGAFVIRDLPAGEYIVTVTAVGRKPHRTTITVAPGRDASHDVALEVGPLMLSSLVVTATRSPT